MKNLIERTRNELRKWMKNKDRRLFDGIFVTGLSVAPFIGNPQTDSVYDYNMYCRNIPATQSALEDSVGSNTSNIPRDSIIAALKEAEGYMQEYNKLNPKTAKKVVYDIRGSYLMDAGLYSSNVECPQIEGVGHLADIGPDILRLHPSYTI